MYCENCGSETDDRAKFCEYCGRAITSPPPSAGRVGPVQSRDTSDAIEGSRKAQTWIWVACGAGLFIFVFSAGLIVFLLEATSRDITPSESSVAVVEGFSPSTRAPTGSPSPEQSGRPAESDTSRRSIKASKPSIPTSSLPLTNPDLYSAVWRGQAEQVRTLVNGGANVNVRASDNDPLLHEAVWRGHTDVVRILVDAGADANARDSDGDPILHEAVWRVHTDVVRILVEAGADVNARDSDGDPILHEAIWRGRKDVVRILVEAGADVNARDSDGDTLLHEASWRGHTEIVQILIAAGAGG